MSMWGCHWAFSGGALFFLFLPISFYNIFPSFCFCISLSFSFSFLSLCCIKKTYIYNINIYNLYFFFVHISLYINCFYQIIFFNSGKNSHYKKLNNCGSIIMETNIFYAIFYHLFFFSS